MSMIIYHEKAHTTGKVLRARETSFDLEGRQSRWQGVNTGTEIRFALLSTFGCSVLSERVDSNRT